MTSEGLGEVFKGDSADTFTGKFPLVSMGGRADRQACTDGERGPPSARAEIFFKSCMANSTISVVGDGKLLLVASRTFNLHHFTEGIVFHFNTKYA